MSENMPCEIGFFSHLIPFFSIIILLNVAYWGKMLHPKRDNNYTCTYMKHHNRRKELLTNHLGYSSKY